MQKVYTYEATGIKNLILILMLRKSMSRGRMIKPCGENLRLQRKYYKGDMNKDTLQIQYEIHKQFRTIMMRRL